MDTQEFENLREESLALSRAYVRLRALIPGAFDTPFAPTPPQIWDVTERALNRMKARSMHLEQLLEWTQDLLGINEEGLSFEDLKEVLASRVKDTIRALEKLE